MYVHESQHTFDIYLGWDMKSGLFIFTFFFVFINLFYKGGVLLVT